MFLPCCCNKTACGQFCIRVFGCPTRIIGRYTILANAQVTLSTRAGVVVGTCVTDASGRCCIGYFTSGAYYYQVDPPPGSHYSTLGPILVNLICGVGFSQDVYLPLQSGWSCQPDFCCAINPDTDTPPYAPSVFPPSVIVNDGIGNIVCALQPRPTLFTPVSYLGLATRRAARAIICIDGPGDDQVTNVDVQIGWIVSCGSNAFGAGWYAAIFYYNMRCGADCMDASAAGLIPVSQDPTCGMIGGSSLTGPGGTLSPAYPSCHAPITFAATATVVGFGPVGSALGEIYGLTGGILIVNAVITS